MLFVVDFPLLRKKGNNIMAVDFSSMTNEEIRKYYESECKDNVNWNKVIEEVSSNSWTDEDEMKNEVF